MTINQIFYNYVKTNITIAALMPSFYIEGDSKTTQPYLTVQMIDDPKDYYSLCVDDQGQSRFLLSIFQKAYTKGINNRETILNEIKKLESTTVSGIRINKIQSMNIWDSDKTIDDLYQFNMEILVEWEK